MNTALDLSDLPGVEHLAPGIEDAAAGRITIASCLVAMARPRLTHYGFLPPDWRPPMVEAEHALYRLLGAEAGDPYSRYNALLRRWVSFQHALDHRATRASAS